MKERVGRNKLETVPKLENKPVLFFERKRVGRNRLKIGFKLRRFFKSWDTKEDCLMLCSKGIVTHDLG